MTLGKIRLGDKNVTPLTIPSGIITTETASIERLANSIPELGILTTKSITLHPKEGNREPILASYSPGSFINAVGLTNPGAEEFSQRLSQAKIPQDKFLLVSAAGGDPSEFEVIIKILEPYADGFELNLSCPHAHGYGMQLGQDQEMVKQIITRASSLTDKPLFAKLSPNLEDIASAASLAITSGAFGITAINTLGPEELLLEGHYVLTNKKGGISGKAALAKGIQYVLEISEAIGPHPIIACGGISSAKDIQAYKKAGASAFGIGSSLAMMRESELKTYFSALLNDLEYGTDNAAGLIMQPDMKYIRYIVAERYDIADDFHILVMDKAIDADAGQFVFAWLPEKGEKPFSVLETRPLKIAFSEKGCFTRELAQLNTSDEIYFRGPYGTAPELPKGSRVALVAGGCGIAGVNLFSMHPNAMQCFIGAKDLDHIIVPHRFTNPSQLFIATEDGSAGHKGMVTDLLKRYADADFFINCGPMQMVDAAVKKELSMTAPDRIYSSSDYMTRCGVGICGSCADLQGRRTCVEGPFMHNNQ